MHFAIFECYIKALKLAYHLTTIIPLHNNIDMLLFLVLQVYVIEIAPTSLKGLLGATHQLFLVLGQLVIYSLGIGLQYHIVALVAGAIGLIHTIAILYIPETPRWLLVNGKDVLAVKALRRLRGHSTNINQELDTLTRSIEREGKPTFAEKLSEFKNPSVVWLAVLCMGLHFFQQFCGIKAVVFYGASIIDSAHVPSPLYSTTFGIGLTQILITFVSVILVGLTGRRTLLTVSGILLLVGTVYLGTYYFICRSGHAYSVCGHTAFRFTALAALLVFLIGFAVGWGPIPWVMMGELAPLKMRGIVSGIAVAVNWFIATIVSLFFSKYQSDSVVHPYGAWWTFAAMIFLSIFFVLIFLPETKGKTLEEIQKDLVFDKRSRVNDK